MTATPDHARFAEWDAAYVLGALSPAERREFEDHLDGCDRCRDTVTEVSALPGLLGRIDDVRAFALLEDAAPASDGGDPADDADGATENSLAGPPVDLVERIQRRDRRDRLRRRFGMAAGLAAAAAIAAVLALVLPPALSPAAEPTLVAQLVASEPGIPVRASVELTSVGWGTRIDMDCEYRPSAPGPNGGYGPVEYAMWVVDSDGAETPLSTWSANPNGTVSVTAGTALAIEDIAEIEVRDASGDRVLLSTDLDES